MPTMTGADRSPLNIEERSIIRARGSIDREARSLRISAKEKKNSKSPFDESRSRAFMRDDSALRDRRRQSIHLDISLS
jgi:hypothetical protein